MNEAVEESARCEDHGAGHDFCAIGANHACSLAVRDQQIFHRDRLHAEIGLVEHPALHGLAIKLPVRLAAWPAHGRSLAAVEEPELDTRGVRDAPHEAVKGVDLADKVALAKSSDGRVARHLADGLELMGKKERLCPKARGRRRRFAACVSAADYHYIPHGPPSRVQPPVCLACMANSMSAQGKDRKPD
jgi:hypothetical protein